MKTIPLTQGKIAIVNDCDYNWLNQWKWHYTSTGYAARTVNTPVRKTILMHREILRYAGSAEVIETDHRDRNRLNNCRNNLRPATASLNGANRQNSRNTSGFHGVDQWQGRWRARIMVQGKRISLGSFSNPKDAAQVYNEAAIKHFGDFAVLNEVD